MMFNIIFLLLLFNSSQANASSTFANHDEQFLIEEDLLLIKDNIHNEPKIRITSENVTNKKFTTETTQELGSGSPDITTTYLPTYFNTSISTIITEFSTTESPFTFETTEESTSFETTNEETTYETTEPITEETTNYETSEETTSYETTTEESTDLSTQGPFTTENVTMFTYVANNTNSSTLSTTLFEETTTEEPATQETTLNKGTTLKGETTSKEENKSETTFNTSLFSTQASFTSYITSNTSNFTTLPFQETTLNANKSNTEATSQFTTFQASLPSEFTSTESTTVYTTVHTSQETSPRVIVTSQSSTKVFVEQTTQQTLVSQTTLITTIPTTSVTTVFMTTEQQTTATTTVLASLLVGKSDVSLRSNWANIDNYASYFIYLTDDQIPLNLLGQTFSTFAIHPNGFVSFGSTSLDIQSPSASIDSYTVPLISPFWFASYIGIDTDISYGRYDATNMDLVLKSKVSELISGLFQERVIQKSRSARSINRAAPKSIDIIYLFTWKNLHFYSNDSSQTATFQLVLATSVSDSKTYAIFWYPDGGLKWNKNDAVVFIGYVSGTKDISNVVNQFSNLKKIKAIPARIYYDQGNTNKIGMILYDVRYGPPNVDPCTAWSDQENIRIKVNRLNKDTNIINCPGTALGALYHPYFDLYRGKTWQTASNNSICFILSTEIFLNIKYQQFCCYDYTNYNYNGALITEGYNAGFSYNSKTIIEVIGNGTICCKDKNANLCNKFYNLFSRQSNDKKKTKIVGSNADVQITTFDGLTYNFNGNGQFVLAKASDFEIQGETRIFENAKDPTKQTTFFDAFAFKAQDSMIFEVRINDANINAPTLDLYVNRANTPFAISNPIEYYGSFNCLINTTNICNSIYMANSSYIKFIFVNGLTLTIQLFSVPLNQFQIQTWASISVKLINTDIDYTNNLSGLFGNFNNIKSDDIRSRSGVSISTNSKSKDIYSTAITWKVDVTQDSKLFLKSTTRIVRQVANSYNPLFLDDLILQNPILAQQVNATCNYVESCVVATLTSGLDAIGSQTRASAQQYQSALDSLSLEPPSISFRNKSVNVDWSMNVPIIIIADVFSSDPNTLAKVFVTVSNAETVSNVQNVVNSTYYTVTITYQPKTGEYPTFQITAVDSKNLTVSISLPEMLICNCRSLDPLNQCLYTSVQNSVNPFVRLVACKCDSYYSGNFCNQTKDYCSLGDWCTIYPGYNTNIVCNSLSASIQKATGLNYNCTGSCSAGFYKDKNGACQDLNECLNSTCPSGSTCVNQIGSSTCSCPYGYIYRKTNNTCEFIDLCKTNQNNCDQTCTPTVGNFTCGCYNGNVFNVTTRKCDKTAALANCNCSQICTLDSNNNTLCTCNKGYQLNTIDNTTCLDINECKTSNPCNNPSNCSNTIGSYTCTCPKGYQLDVDGASCIECPFGTYGYNCNETCNCAYATGCDSVDGCICQTGYNGINCDNLVDLCPYGTFNQTTTQCLTFQGYYQLVCLTGYEKGGKDDNCTAINYCSSLRNICPNDATCVQVNGGFTCQCGSGYTYDSGTNKCADEDECVLNKSNCPLNSKCQNVVGSYICTCNTGFASNVNDTTNRNPNCTNINECIFPNICATNLTCKDTIGSYNCLCFDGTIAVNGLCNYSIITTTTTSKPSDQSTPVAVGLILSIVLPIGVVLVLAILAALVCYFWFKTRAENLSSKKSKETYAQSLTKNLNNLGSKQPIEKSMFQRDDDDLDSNYLNNFQEDYNDILNGSNQNGIRSIYRPNYLFEEGIAKSDVDFFKSLEDLASSSQRTTIARPHSIFSDSSISLPTAYYEHTTPYLRSTFPQLDSPDDFNRIDEADEPDDDIIKNNDLNYDDDIELNNFEDPFDNDNDIGDFVEAYNPNVKIPRPKLQFNPSNLFKFGPSPGESNQ